MLQKILRLRNIGRFDPDAKMGSIEFGPLTVVYADNARGKTTLAAALDSLSSGDPTRVLERRQLGSTGRIAAHIRCSDREYKFKDGKWDANMPGLVVFDSHFVENNVHSGVVVQTDHRRNLHTFAIGERGVELQKELEKLEAQTEELREEQKTMKQAIARDLPDDVTVETYCNLQHDREIEEKIDKRKKQLKAAKGARTIAEKPLLQSVVLPDFDLRALQNLLTKTIRDVKPEAQRAVRNHIAEHLGEGGEEWIERGFQVTERTDDCPFCGQELSDSTLFAYYEQYFSEAYRELNECIGSMHDDVDAVFSLEKLRHLQGILTNNRELHIFWSDYIDVELPELPFERVETLWNAARDSLMGLLEEKREEPLREMDVDARALEHWKGLAESPEVRTYNEAIEKYNKAIREQKERTRGASVEGIENALKMETLRKQRYESTEVERCKAYVDKQAEMSDADKKRKEKQEKVRSHSRTVLRQYQGRINGLLSKFGATFEIQELKPYFRAKPAAVEYALCINDCTVPLEPDGEEPEPCFQNTLSQGDKSTLAFAFFIARLENMDLNDTIVVFDDPLAAMDAFRTFATQEVIAQITRKAEQVLVLSNNPFFLRRIVEQRPTIPDTQKLRLKRGANGSVLSPWDMDEDTLDSYSQDFFMIAEYLEGETETNKRQVARAIRPVMERQLRTKFPQKLRSENNLGGMLSVLREAAEEGAPLVSQDTYEEASEINNYACKYHHDTNPNNYPNERVPDAELRQYCERAVKFVRGKLG